MIDAPLALAFAAGLVAAFNPCGFAMLPAYLGFFVGRDAGEPPATPTAAIARALAVAATVSAGFVLVFGAAGLAITEASLSVQRWSEWLTIVVGVALVPLGIAMVFGFEPKVGLPRFERGGTSRGLDSMFLFGVSYAVVSLSCTLPVFLPNVAYVFQRRSFASGVAVFIAYAAGMALVLGVLTVALALAEESIVRHLRRLLPYVNRVAGGVLVVAGAYVAYYGWYATRITSGRRAAAGPVDAVTELSADVQSWVDRVGPTRLGLIALVVLVAVVAIAAVLRDPSGRAAELGEEPDLRVGVGPEVDA